MGGGEGLKGGLVSSWRQEAPSEPPDKQCFQTREQGGSSSKVFFSRAEPALSGHEEGAWKCGGWGASRNKQPEERLWAQISY